ncbi:MAG TPA: PLP-dependent aminotransferase family protein [Clostridiales bacterium]|nr:PLP-dependent aminotransferase family protein [Clostridiales bacterium]
MNYTFSDRVSNLKPSAIREIFKYAADPQVISLSAGNPSPEAFPVKAISEISQKIFKENPIAALQYSVTEGYAPLRSHLKEYMKEKHNIGAAFDDLIVTSGAQQVMDLAAKSLCNEGDTVICEAPSFIGSLNSFRSYNAKLCGVPMDSDGINIEKLENALQTKKNVRFMYLIPNFQNPSGITMSLEKRKAVYELAKKYGVLIIEDNPYGDLRYSGEYIPTIKSMDTEGLVIYVGSFSKVLSPGIRVGWCVAPQQIISKMVVCKQGQDVHTNIWSQMVAYEFMTKYDFDGHITFLQNLYRKKADLMMNLLDEHLAPQVTYNRINGGLFIMCQLPNNINMTDFCKQAVLRKVCVVPGNAFLTDESQPCQLFRVNFSTPTDEQLIKGVEILGKLAKEMC